MQWRRQEFVMGVFLGSQGNFIFFSHRLKFSEDLALSISSSINVSTTLLFSSYYSFIFHSMISFGTIFTLYKKMSKRNFSSDPMGGLLSPKRPPAYATEKLHLKK